jgi:hypothetical protein
VKHSGNVWGSGCFFGVEVMGVLELNEIRAQVRLEKTELKIYDAHDCPKSYSSIGQALSEIRQYQYWKIAGFNSWGEYCLSRFNYTDQQTDELIATVVSGINMIAATEKQLEEIRIRFLLERAEKIVINPDKYLDPHAFPKVEPYSTIGQALLDIYQKQLWKVTGSITWYEYCLSKFDYTERRADELIESAIVRKNLEKEREKELEKVRENNMEPEKILKLYSVSSVRESLRSDRSNYLPIPESLRKIKMTKEQLIKLYESDLRQACDEIGGDLSSSHEDIEFTVLGSVFFKGVELLPPRSIDFEHLNDYI